MLWYSASHEMKERGSLFLVDLIRRAATTCMNKWPQDTRQYIALSKITVLEDSSAARQRKPNAQK